MITKKKLLERVKSLEEFFNIVYSSPETKNDYAEHFQRDYGLVHDITKIIRERKNEKIPTPKKK